MNIINGNALHIPLADGCVQCVVTSPPYYGLRDYGVDGQIGLEQTPAEYIANLMAVFRECWRVMRADGTLWLNIGDSYASDTKGSGGPSEKQCSNAGSRYGARKFTHDAKPKDLLGIPWRVAFALQADGWYLRSDIIWHKPNPMPESVTDRPTKAHEYMFLLAKQERYFYDAEAIKEPIVREWGENNIGKNNRINTGVMEGVVMGRDTNPHCGLANTMPSPSGRNRRTVWTIATSPYSGAHFAVFPPALVEPCILAGTSARGQCPVCGAPWERAVEVETVREQAEKIRPVKEAPSYKEIYGGLGDKSGVSVAGNMPKSPIVSTVGWQPTCTCNAGDPVPQLVFDPFSGTSTVGTVAIKHRRRYAGLELNPDYIGLACKRMTGVQIAAF